jgi:hypothetical protein
MKLSDFKNYKVGGIVCAVHAEYLTEKIVEPPRVYRFDPAVDGYLAWLPPTVGDFLALVGFRVVVKGRRNNDGASTEHYPFINHLKRATGTTSTTLLAKRLGIEPSKLRKYMAPTKFEDPIRWMPTHVLRELIANASIDIRVKHSNTVLPIESRTTSRNFKLLTTLETGVMMRAVDQDELYAKVAYKWKNRFGERRELSSPSAADLPWLLEAGRAVSAEMWSSHTLFQQLCLEECAIQKALPVWSNCGAYMHAA